MYDNKCSTNSNSICITRKHQRSGQEGFYKNKSEAIIDAVRHFVGFRETESDVAMFIRDELKGTSPKRGYSEKEFDVIWDKVRHGKEWKERFGKDADSVMAKLRGRQ